MKTITKTSKSKTILLCCTITFLIAAVVSMTSEISIHEFMKNILEWDSM